MCTAISFKAKDHYFGRTLDLEHSYNETVTITPRNFEFRFRKMPCIEKHFAIIGMATVVGGYPLYYDATNEKGLSIAGLNFPENAFYNEIRLNSKNIAPFELIPFLLSRCGNVSEAVNLINNINLANINFSDEYPLSPLHWIIADKNESVTVEPLKGGVKIYKNPVGVLTNSPPFDYQMTNLSNYLSLTKSVPKNTFCDRFELTPYSRGMGAIGLPGDFSSVSRFVKAAFVKENSVYKEDENSAVNQFFHILSSVSQPKGSVQLDDGKYVSTIYTSCCNIDNGLYYYTTYENLCISAVNMYNENLDTNKLITYPLLSKPSINYQN